MLADWRIYFSSLKSFHAASARQACVHVLFAVLLSYRCAWSMLADNNAGKKIRVIHPVYFCWGTRWVEENAGLDYCLTSYPAWGRVAVLIGFVLYWGHENICRVQRGWLSLRERDKVFVFLDWWVLFPLKMHSIACIHSPLCILRSNIVWILLPLSWANHVLVAFLAVSLKISGLCHTSNHSLQKSRLTLEHCSVGGDVFQLTPFKCPNLKTKRNTPWGYGRYLSSH